MPQAVTVKRVGLTVELLLFKAYGRRGNTSDMLDRTFALNPGLAARGAELPLQTSLLLADLPAAKVARKRAAVSLFGD